MTSGLRIGTPALATRGFTTDEFVEVADIIAETLIAGRAVDVDSMKKRVKKLTDAFPLYDGLD